MKYYLSNEGINPFEYKQLVSEIDKFGWEITYSWPPKSFGPGAGLSKTIFEKAIAGISKSEIFIAKINGSSRTALEVGLAYTWSQEIVLFGDDKLLFNPRYIDIFPCLVLLGVNRFVCTSEQLPAKLREHYLYLVNN